MTQCDEIQHIQHSHLPVYCENKSSNKNAQLMWKRPPRRELVTKGDVVRGSEATPTLKARCAGVLFGLFKKM